MFLPLSEHELTHLAQFLQQTRKTDE